MINTNLLQICHSNSLILSSILEFIPFAITPIPNLATIIQDDQKVSVHLMITIQKLQVMFRVSPASLQTFIDRDTRLTLTPSVIPNSNYVIMVGD